MSTNYFVCTLGQASLRDDGEKARNVNGLLDRQARRVPKAFAAGFLLPNSQASEWDYRVLTFEDVWRGTNIVAELLSQKLVSTLPSGQTVALLCPTSVDFLFVWLALIRLGHPVLLVAPQCQPSAIAHLCRTCEVFLLLYHDVYEDLALRAFDVRYENDLEVLQTLQTRPISFGEHVDIYDTILRTERVTAEKPETRETSIAYLHHTSGTSSGFPKPIPQTHRAAVGVLPYIPSRSQKATFTTTPLYHGGIADLFRAWTSDAMIWLFPETEIPVTASNIVDCLGTAERCSVRKNTPLVGYFSSVPYVLQMMAMDQHGLDHLKRMDKVGVGGAALPTEVGDKLVKLGINLVSRFGSAECGFLMSSHRDYKKDKEWQYLRPDSGNLALKFEAREEGTWELVIQPEWPHMVSKHFVQIILLTVPSTRLKETVRMVHLPLQIYSFCTPAFLMLGSTIPGQIRSLP